MPCRAVLRFEELSPRLVPDGGPTSNAYAAELTAAITQFAETYAAASVAYHEVYGDATSGNATPVTAPPQTDAEKLAALKEQLKKLTEQLVAVQKRIADRDIQIKTLTDTSTALAAQIKTAEADVTAAKAKYDKAADIIARSKDTLNPPLAQDLQWAEQNITKFRDDWAVKIGVVKGLKLAKDGIDKQITTAKDANSADKDTQADILIKIALLIEEINQLEKKIGGGGQPAPKPGIDGVF